MSDGKCSVILCELGIILLDENENVSGSTKFTNPVESYRLIKNGGRLAGIGQIIGMIGNYSDIRSNDQSLNFFLQQNGISSTLMSDDELRMLLLQKDSILEKAKFVSNKAQAQRAAPQVRDRFIIIQDQRNIRADLTCTSYKQSVPLMNWTRSSTQLERECGNGTVYIFLSLII